MNVDSEKETAHQRSRRHLNKALAVAGAAALARLFAPNKAMAASPCFLKGTEILTAAGYKKVEDLTIGEMLPTRLNGLQPVQWIGRYSYKKSDPAKKWAKVARPVRVARSAIEDNVPSADLYVTTGHAFYIDGVLVPAGSLINGTTITLDDASGLDEIAYYHVKLESHDVIDAQGAPVETLLTVNEAAHNFAEYYRLYGQPLGDWAPCAPIESYDGGRSELRSRLRSAFSPWIDRRHKLDVIRDRLEERGMALKQALAHA